MRGRGGCRQGFANNLSHTSAHTHLMYCPSVAFAPTSSTIRSARVLFTLKLILLVLVEFDFIKVVIALITGSGTAVFALRIVALLVGRIAAAGAPRATVQSRRWADGTVRRESGRRVGSHRRGLGEACK